MSSLKTFILDIRVFLMDRLKSKKKMQLVRFFHYQNLCIVDYISKEILLSK